MDLENSEFLEVFELKILARRPQDLRDVVMIDDFIRFGGGEGTD